MRQVGVQIPKVDALEKVLGEAKYGADLSSQKPLYLKVVRSPKPHAKIVNIETSEALRGHGVERIFTAKDIPGRNRVGTINKDQPILASNRVRYIGDPVALVAAQTEEEAEEAASKVIVIYEDLPFINLPEEALRLDAPLIHDKGNLLLEFRVSKGDIQIGFKDADLIIEKTYTTTWIEHAYLEPDAGLSYLDEEGRITVVCPTQNVHYDQKEVAAFPSLPLEKVRIIQCTTGGGFGGRLDITIQCLLSLAAFHLAMGPGDALYVTAPTMATYDCVYRIDRQGAVTVISSEFGRPQGMAVDADGTLYVVDAVAGGAGLYRVREGSPRALVLAATSLVGAAFDPAGGLIAASNDTVYRLDVGLRPWRAR